MVFTNSLADRLDSFNWRGESTARYERLKNGVTTMNPWNKRIFYLLPPVLIFTWMVYLFNPLGNIGSHTATIEAEDATPDYYGSSSTVAAGIIAATQTAHAADIAAHPTYVAPMPSVSVVYVPYKQEYNATKVALLIEDRPIPHLAPLLLHMINVVPPDWRFRFMGSQESIDFINSSLPVQMYEKMGKLDMGLIPSNLTVKGQQELSETFTNLWFYETLLAPAEYLLVFQTDSIMCANSGKDLNDWLQWDWVGAPWSYNAASGGNGGLSLRRVRPIINLLKKESRPNGHPELEDLWLCNRLVNEPGINMANGTVESEFSVEAVWREKPMGYHTGWSGARLPPDVWDAPERRKHIFDYCPEMKITMNMKLEREGCETPAAIKKREADFFGSLAAW